MQNNASLDNKGPIVSKKIQSVFVVFWGMSIFFHIIAEFNELHAVTTQSWGTSSQILGTESLILGFCALCLVFRPHNRYLLIATATLQLINVWLRLPTINNHWMLGGWVSLAMLLAVLSSRNQNTKEDQANRLFSILIPATILILVTAYPFAAFAKWNSSFMNPEVSCAVDLFTRGYELVGLDSLARFPIVRWGLIGITLFFETTIALLILWPRSRSWGALLGLFFHYILTLDLAVPFFNFTSILFLFFILCLPKNILVQLAGWADLQLAERWKKWVVGGAMGLVLFAPLIDSAATQIFFALGRGVVWLFFGTPILIWVFRQMFFQQQNWSDTFSIWPSKESKQQLPKAILLTLLSCTLLMGLSPWLEIQTGYGLTMYSNLLTAQGETNHIIMPRTFPIGRGYYDLIEITAADPQSIDPFFIGTGWQIPSVTAKQTLAQHPELDAEILRQGNTSTFSQENDLYTPLPYLQQKLQNLRPVDGQDAVRCQIETYRLNATD